MKFIATKTADRLDLQALHQVRERLVRQRTGTIKQIRAFLLERGIAVRQGLRFLHTELSDVRQLEAGPRVIGLCFNGNRFCNLASAVDEERHNRIKRAILQRYDSDWPRWNRQFHWQNPEPWEICAKSPQRER